MLMSSPIRSDEYSRVCLERRTPACRTSQPLRPPASAAQRPPGPSSSCARRARGSCGCLSVVRAFTSARVASAMTNALPALECTTTGQPVSLYLSTGDADGACRSEKASRPFLTPFKVRAAYVIHSSRECWRKASKDMLLDAPATEMGRRSSSVRASDVLVALSSAEFENG